MCRKSRPPPLLQAKTFEDSPDLFEEVRTCAAEIRRQSGPLDKRSGPLEILQAMIVRTIGQRSGLLPRSQVCKSGVSTNSPDLLKKN